MTDHEKEILDKIKQSTEKTPVPESLAPDQIMKRLEEHNSTHASGHIHKKHGFSRGQWMRGGLIAAALVLVVGIGTDSGHTNPVPMDLMFTLLLNIPLRLYLHVRIRLQR